MTQGLGIFSTLHWYILLLVLAYGDLITKCEIVISELTDLYFLSFNMKVTESVSEGSITQTAPLQQHATSGDTVESHLS